VSEAERLQWKAGDEILRKRAMHHRACQIRYSLHSFGTKVACPREVPVDVRSNSRMEGDVIDHGGVAGDEAVGDNETPVITPLVLGGTQQDLGWMASVRWQIQPSDTWQVFLIISCSFCSSPLINFAERQCARGRSLIAAPRCRFTNL
jgi:hypothetical protein